MNTYVLIVLIGLLIKLWVSHYALNRERQDHKSELNIIILLSAITFATLSIPQAILLADGAWATPLGLDRYLVLRWYLFHGVLCITIGFYFMLSVFYPQYLAIRASRLSLKLLSIAIVIISAALILFSDAMFDPSYVTKQALSIELGKGADDTYLVVIRLMAVIFYSLLFIVFLRNYKNASDHQSQNINLYALFAIFLSIAECIATVFYLHPLMFSVKGLFFTVVIFLACSDRKVYDMRPAALVTLEAKTGRDMQRIFRSYAHSELRHKDAMQRLEKVLVSYKLQKVSDFREPKGSPLPDVAENMDMRLSTLYELLKRLGIRRP